jgi:hypothetical protein
MKKKGTRDKLCVYRKTKGALGAHLSTYLADWDHSERAQLRPGSRRSPVPTTVARHVMKEVIITFRFRFLPLTIHPYCHP